MVGEKVCFVKMKVPLRQLRLWSCHEETRSCLFKHESKNESGAPSFYSKPFRMSSSPSETAPHVTSENILHFCQSQEILKHLPSLCYQMLF